MRNDGTRHSTDIEGYKRTVEFCPDNHIIQNVLVLYISVQHVFGNTETRKSIISVKTIIHRII